MLAAGSDPTLSLDFLVPVVDLSLSFGGDDLISTEEGGLAILTIFDDGVLVAETSVLLNRNLVLDQTITVSGGAFNRALLRYSRGNPVVDNISFEPVPEPTTFLLIGTGLSVIAARVCKRPHCRRLGCAEVGSPTRAQAMITSR